MDYSLPVALTSTPLSLVSLVGLKDKDDLFNRFAENRAHDRAPLQFSRYGKEHENLYFLYLDLQNET